MGNVVDGLAMLCAHDGLPDTGYPWIAEGKYDGFRMLFYIDAEQRVTVSSRAGGKEKGNTEPFTRNFQHISEHLVHMGFKSCLVDGEVSAGDWNRTAKLARLKNPTAEQMAEIQGSIHFNVFDVIWDRDIETYETSRGRVVRCSRRNALARRDELELFVPENHLVVRLVKRELVHNPDEAMRVHLRHLKEGHEGSVFKQPYSTYEFDRSNQWRAVKPVETVDGQILECIEGAGKHKGRLGALKVRLEDGNIVNFGTGYDDKTRADLWARRAEIINWWIEGTRQDGGAQATARHPVFLRLRGPEKV